ncbi:nuclear pore complex protein Nup96 [Dorcoceras hygrometricum]|uniref:Nuclear pore complex protein Nup96 n=1 Tax=Dorcoceras hygrometricum TaxID=472368 RepID=A0A2Z7AZB1_9LAMI|nr:nuclear pore complex protein Nup96 [Dorcoceras hygrometricum]
MFSKKLFNSFSLSCCLFFVTTLRATAVYFLRLVDRYDDVTVAATSFFNRYDDVMVSFFNRYDDVIKAVSRFLSISNADVIVAARSFLQASENTIYSLAHITIAGLNWPPPDYEQPTQLWTSPLLIQLPFTLINQTNC